MVAVSIVAIAFGSAIELVRLDRLGKRYAARSAAHTARGAFHQERLNTAIAAVKRVLNHGPARAAIAVKNLAITIEYETRAVACETDLSSKYRRAAARPWRSVVPDPPPPDRAQIAADDFASTVIQLMQGTTYLDLKSTGATDGDLALIEGWSELRALCLDGTKITDDGLAYLRGLSKLQSLSLERTTVSDRGLEKLCTLLSLKRINLFGSRVTREGAGMLAAALPEAAVEY
jgi:hypothetical protein